MLGNSDASQAPLPQTNHHGKVSTRVYPLHSLPRLHGVLQQGVGDPRDDHHHKGMVECIDVFVGGRQLPASIYREPPNGTASGDNTHVRMESRWRKIFFRFPPFL